MVHPFRSRNCLPFEQIVFTLASVAFESRTHVHARPDNGYRILQAFRHQRIVHLSFSNGHFPFDFSCFHKLLVELFAILWVVQLWFMDFLERLIQFIVLEHFFVVTDPIDFLLFHLRVLFIVMLFRMWHGLLFWPWRIVESK